MGTVPFKLVAFFLLILNGCSFNHVPAYRPISDVAIIDSGAQTLLGIQFRNRREYQILPWLPSFRAGMMTDFTDVSQLPNTYKSLFDLFVKRNRKPIVVSSKADDLFKKPVLYRQMDIKNCPLLLAELPSGYYGLEDGRFLTIGKDPSANGPSAAEFGTELNFSYLFVYFGTEVLKGPNYESLVPKGLALNEGEIEKLPQSYGELFSILESHHGITIWTDDKDLLTRPIVYQTAGSQNNLVLSVYLPDHYTAKMENLAINIHRTDNRGFVSQKE